MPAFAYQARDRSGVSQQGTLTAPSMSGAVTGLRERGWLVVDVRAATPGDLADSWTVWLDPREWLPVRSVDVELSFQQLAVMLRSGLTLLAALDTVTRTAERPAMRRVWRAVSTAIIEGVGMADALARHRCFDDYSIQLVRVGEQTGRLDEVLREAAQSLESQRKLFNSVIAALIYPTIVIVAAIAVTLYMLVGVIPKLEVFLRALGKKLPPITQLLLDISAFVQLHGITMLIGFFAAILAFVLLYLWPPGRLRIDYVALRIPMLGGLFQLAGSVTFSRGLSVLLNSGVTLLEGLSTVQRLLSNKYLAQLVGEARDGVMRGEPLAPSMTKDVGFEPLLISMVAVGEEAGSLDAMLDECADFHEAQLAATLQQLTAWLEPIITIVLGAIVGFVYLAFFMALFAAGS